jgi:hypothetical protein
MIKANLANLLVKKDTFCIYFLTTASKCVILEMQPMLLDGLSAWGILCNPRRDKGQERSCPLCQP